MWQARTLHLHGVEVVHRVQAWEGGALFDVVVHADQLGAEHVDLRVAVHVLGGRRPAGVQREMHISQIIDLTLDHSLRGPVESRLVEGHLGTRQLLGHEPAYVSHATVSRLTPGLQQELVLQPRVIGDDLQLQNVDDAHQQLHAVVPAPELELRLVVLDLLEKSGTGLEALCAPPLGRQAVLHEPDLERLRRREGTLFLGLLQLTSLEQVPLDGRPIQPVPSVDVLQLSLAGAVVGIVVLQGVEIDAWEAAADDVHSVQVVRSLQPREALGLLDLDGVVDELLVDHLQGALVLGIEVGRRIRGTDDEGGVD
mmetsp:Transcript_3053/g.11830  ORF Transcript_3053/g.11830 Transcript_3053/m.11830 type:complete len:311 (+) Transcript_3053:796-1728(+)